MKYRAMLATGLTPETSESLQREWMQMGYVWPGAYPAAIKHTDKPALSTCRHGLIHYHHKNVNALHATARRIKNK